MPTRKIALEEAFTIAAFKDREHAMVTYINPKWGAYVKERIADLTDRRLKDMDSAGIDMQVLSLTVPGIQGMTDTGAAISTARQANDFVAEVVRKYPTRFAAFAALPCQDPAAAVAQLKRAVNELGLCGALINGHTNGVYLDDQKFWGLWELSESLHVPIYIHPIDPPTPFACCTGYPPPGGDLRMGLRDWYTRAAGHPRRRVRSFPRGTSHHRAHGRIPALQPDADR
jgi:2,3-dihydroxybenzoate decarboxylase